MKKAQARLDQRSQPKSGTAVADIIGDFSSDEFNVFGITSCLYTCLLQSELDGIRSFHRSQDLSRDRTDSFDNRIDPVAVVLGSIETFEDNSHGPFADQLSPRFCGQTSLTLRVGV